MQPPKPYHDTRPWGDELWLTRTTGAPSMVKVIRVNPGESLSLQLHHNRDEFWCIISGDGIAEIAKDSIPLQKDVVCFIPRDTKHRIVGGSSILVLVELTFGEFSEDDIVRFEDKYGRS